MDSFDMLKEHLKNMIDETDEKKLDEAYKLVTSTTNSLRKKYDLPVRAENPRHLSVLIPPHEQVRCLADSIDGVGPRIVERLTGGFGTDVQQEQDGEQKDDLRLFHLFFTDTELAGKHEQVIVRTLHNSTGLYPLFHDNIILPPLLGRCMATERALFTRPIRLPNERAGVMKVVDTPQEATIAIFFFETGAIIPVLSTNFPPNELKLHMDLVRQLYLLEGTFDRESLLERLSAPIVHQ
jgi:hypothetical protein